VIVKLLRDRNESYAETLLEGLFQASAWYDGAASMAMFKEI
jgi:hypothetical protein